MCQNSTGLPGQRATISPERGALNGALVQNFVLNRR
jgi:hypothetical protein